MYIRPQVFVKFVAWAWLALHYYPIHFGIYSCIQYCKWKKYCIKGISQLWIVRFSGRPLYYFKLSQLITYNSLVIKYVHLFCRKMTQRTLPTAGSLASLMAHIQRTAIRCSESFERSQDPETVDNCIRCMEWSLINLRRVQPVMTHIESFHALAVNCKVRGLYRVYAIWDN